MIILKRKGCGFPAFSKVFSTSNSKRTYNLNEASDEKIRQFVSQYFDKKKNLSMQRFIQFAKQSKGQSIRCSKYLTHLKRICIQYQPVIKEKIQQIRQPVQIVSIIKLFSLVNLHRAKTYQILEELVSKKRTQISLVNIQLFKMAYFMACDQKNENLNLNNILKDINMTVFKEHTIKRYFQNQKTVNTIIAILNEGIFLLKSMLLQRFSSQNKAFVIKILNEILKVTQSKEAKSIGIENMLRLLRCQNGSLSIANFVYQSIILFRLQKHIKDTIFQCLLKTIYKQMKAIIQKNYFSRLKQSRLLDLRYNQSMSILQTIVHNKLKKMGYGFFTNYPIGVYEFDFVVSLQSSIPQNPFQTVDRAQLQTAIEQKKLIGLNLLRKQLTTEQIKRAKSNVGFSYVKVKSPLKNHVVLNVNGPTHYIDSDVYGVKQLTRTEQMKYLFLQMHGFNKVNILDYFVWQEVRDSPTISNEYLEKLISCQIKPYFMK